MLVIEALLLLAVSTSTKSCQFSQLMHFFCQVISTFQKPLLNIVEDRNSNFPKEAVKVEILAWRNKMYDAWLSKESHFEKRPSESRVV